MVRKCFIYAETWWTKGCAGLFFPFDGNIFFSQVFHLRVATSGETARNGPNRSPLRPIWAFPKCLHYSVSNVNKVSNTLWAFPREWPIP